MKGSEGAFASLLDFAKELSLPGMANQLLLFWSLHSHGERGRGQLKINRVVVISAMEKKTEKG